MKMVYRQLMMPLQLYLRPSPFPPPTFSFRLLRALQAQCGSCICFLKLDHARLLQETPIIFIQTREIQFVFSKFSKPSPVLPLWRLGQRSSNRGIKSQTADNLKCKGRHGGETNQGKMKWLGEGQKGKTSNPASAEKSREWEGRGWDAGGMQITCDKIVYLRSSNEQDEHFSTPRLLLQNQPSRNIILENYTFIAFNFSFIIILFHLITSTSQSDSPIFELSLSPIMQISAVRGREGAEVRFYVNNEAVEVNHSPRCLRSAQMEYWIYLRMLPWLCIQYTKINKFSNKMATAPGSTFPTPTPPLPASEISCS